MGTRLTVQRYQLEDNGPAAAARREVSRVAAAR